MKEVISYALVRVGDDGEQSYAGMFTSERADFQKLLEEARADGGLHLIRLVSDAPLPPVTWAEVELADVTVVDVADYDV